jgi:hypothetical protein
MAEKVHADFSDGGILTSTFVEQDGTIHVQKQQDIQANIDYATRLRNAEDYSADGIRKGMWHVAHIPDVVIVELMGIGINVYTAPVKQIVAGLRTLHKEHLLTTTKQI